MDLYTDTVPSPIGDMLVVSDGKRLCALDFHDYEARKARLLERYYGDVRLSAATNPGGICDRLRHYLDGDLEAIDDIAVAQQGSAFQNACWAMLRRIPAGSTWSYGELARALGKPNASRAVGLANGSNPIAVVVPCHRVIGASGQLTGYGGGLERKRWLLMHEGALLI